MLSNTHSPLPIDAKIYIAGHTGLVGSAVLRRLHALGYRNLITRSSKELDLTSQKSVEDFFNEQKPQFAFLCAAKVGGILANSTYPADFIYQNLMIQNHLIHEAMKHNVERLLFLGSSCIYPRSCPQPMKEEHLLTSSLEQTNRPYAVAKIAGIEMCWAYNRQYKTRYLGVMPTNLYGPGDHYDLNTSHVLPALMRKMHEAKLKNISQVHLWGTGSARREFLHCDDLADAVVHLMSLPDHQYDELLSSQVHAPIINIGCGQDVTIKELAELIADVVGFNGEFVWDKSKPDGTPKKLLDVSRLNQLGWHPRISLQEGVAATYRDAEAMLTQMTF